jgi:hypothetical protein
LEEARAEHLDLFLASLTYSFQLSGSKEHEQSANLEEIGNTKQKIGREKSQKM